MDDENKNENINLEEKDLDDMVAENISTMYEALQDMKVGSEEWRVTQEELRAWYNSYSDVHIKSAKVVSEDTQRSMDRASNEEIEKEKLKTKGREIVAQIGIALAQASIGIFGSALLGKMFADQQNKIIAAEYCDDKYIMNKSFQMDYDALKSLVLKRNS